MNADRRSGQGRHRLIGFGFLVASTVLIGLHVNAYTRTSPIDELSHIDTLIKSSRFQLVQGNERVGQHAMREEACRGLDRPDPVPPCDTARFNPQEFRDLGVNVIARRLPVYHFLTGVVARLLVELTNFDSIVTAARFCGAIWLALGLWFTWLVMLELSVGFLARMVTLPLLATTPVALHAGAIVNSDATLLFAGAAIFLATLRWERGAAPTWSLMTAALIGIALEPAAIVAVALSGVYLVLRPLRVPAAERSPYAVRRWSTVGAVTLLLGAATVILLPVLHDALIGKRPVVEDPVTPTEEAFQHRAIEVVWAPVPAGKILGEMPGLVTPVKRPYIPALLAGPPLDVMVTFTDWLLLGSVLALGALAPPLDRRETLALCALATMLAAGPVHAVWNAQRDVFFAIPARFGLPLLPLLFALLASTLRNATALAAAALLAASSVIYVVIKLLAGSTWL